MVLLTGFFRDSGGSAIASGILRIRLDAPVFDFSATPDALYLQQPAEFAITNGAIGTINLVESATQQVTYEFTLLVNSNQIEFYFPNGDRYDGPTHLHTDSKYYTGYSHRTDSQELDRLVRQVPRQIDQFHAIVPNAASVEYSQLLPTRVATDKLPTTIRQIAELLINDQQYRQALRGGPAPAGVFSPTTFYVEDDWVEYDGSSYVYINPITTRGNYPPNATYWQLMAARGATGTGTSGNNTSYDATTWDGQLDAPSRNAVRDIIEQLARASQLASLAPINSPTFTGTPSRSTNPIAGDRSTQFPTTQWVGNEFATLNSPTFTGNPAVPLQLTTDRSNKIASTQWTENYFNSRNVLNTPLFAARKTNAQALSTGNNTLSFNVESIDSDNAFTPSTATFVVPTGKAGWYEFIATVYLERSSGTSFDAFLEIVDGSTVHRLHHTLGNTFPAFSISGAARLFLTDGASISLRVVFAGSATVSSNNAYANTVLTTFSGMRINV